MATVPIVTEVTKAQLDALVAANELNEGLQYKITDKGWLVIATSGSTYIFTNSVPYHTCSMLLNQNTVSQTSGVLIVGKSYRINELLGDDDFTNCGYIQYESDTFICTNANPTKWTNETIVVDIDLSKPILTILENTIGIIESTYAGLGTFDLKSNQLFKDGKTVAIIQSFTPDDVLISTEIRDEDTIRVRTKNTILDSVDDVLINTYLNIRVYQI